jgi:hypothetical protein
MNISTTIKKLKASKKLPFTDVLSAKEIEKHFETISYRDRIFPPDVTVFGFLSQVMSEDQSCQGAVAQVIAQLASQGKETPSANTAAYSKARSRLPEEVLSGLTKESAEQLELQAKLEWLWRNRHVKLIDGSTVTMPDTKENQASYPQPDSQKEGAGFPIARIVAVISLAAGVVMDLAIGPYAGKRTGEHALLRQLMHNFNPGDIVLGDCYYASFFFDSCLYANGRGCCFPNA